MPGYIDNSVGEGLWEGYNGGRAASGVSLPQTRNLAQWSALLDAGTCDWCGWADERIFNMAVEPYDPPMHWGCRCILAFILSSEFPPNEDWGSGPPKPSWPPGTKGGMVDGKPTLINSGKNVKPKGQLNEHFTKQWEDHIGRKMPKQGSDSYGYGVNEEMRLWEKQALREISLEGGEFSAHEIDQAIDRLNWFIERWTAETSPAKKKLGELMARGSVDEIQTLYGEAIGTTSTQEVKALIRVWEAHKDLATSTMRASNLSVDGKVTLYRGTSAQRGSTKAFQTSVESGDLEQMMGADFIESWTTDIKAARLFSGDSGMIFKKSVDVEDVFAHWQEHQAFGSYLQESEVIWYNWDSTLVPKAVFNADEFGATIVEVF